MLVVVLGAQNGKLCCLDADELSASDKEKIRSRVSYLDRLPLEERIRAVKKLCPSAMRHYKTININNFVVDKEYKIQKIKPPKA